MGITTLLSMTVFLMLVAENMPATSDVLPLVGMSSRQAIIVFYLMQCPSRLCALNIPAKQTSAIIRAEAGDPVNQQLRYFGLYSPYVRISVHIFLNE